VTGSKTLSPTLEDYLETISHLTEEKGNARVRDIARAVSVHKSTVTAALKSLAQKDLVTYAPYEVATLTDQGSRMAEDVARRHDVIRRFLSEVLRLEEETAESNACRMEHAMDREALERLRSFVEFVENHPRVGSGWVKRWHSRDAR